MSNSSSAETVYEAEARVRTHRLALVEPIKAVDRLNSWVRSESYRRAGHASSPKRAVYWLKHCALEAAHATNLASHKLIAVPVKCRDCGGTGQYTSMAGDKYPHCHKCGSGGLTILYFVETDIAAVTDQGTRDPWHGLVTWHSPIERFPLVHERLANRVPYTSFTWKPNQAGKDLTPAEVARDLNTAETFFTERPGPRYTHDGGPYNDFAYSLYLGATDPTRCDLCLSATPRPGAYGVHRKITPTGTPNHDGARVAWFARACVTCEAGYRGRRLGCGNDLFDVFPVPAEPLADEHIRAWIERRCRDPRERGDRYGGTDATKGSV